MRVIISMLLISILLTGCSKEPEINYNAKSVQPLDNTTREVLHIGEESESDNEVSDNTVSSDTVSDSSLVENTLLNQFVYQDEQAIASVPVSAISTMKDKVTVVLGKFSTVIPDNYEEVKYTDSLNMFTLPYVDESTTYVYDDGENINVITYSYISNDKISNIFHNPLSGLWRDTITSNSDLVSNVYKEYIDIPNELDPTGKVIATKNGNLCQVFSVVPQTNYNAFGYSLSSIDIPSITYITRVDSGFYLITVSKSNKEALKLISQLRTKSFIDLPKDITDEKSTATYLANFFTNDVDMTSLLSTNNENRLDVEQLMSKILNTTYIGDITKD